MRTQQANELFINSRIAAGLSPQTIRWYRGILNCFALQCPKLPSKPELIEAFIASCKGGDERRHGYYRTLRAYYRFLSARYHVINPLELINPPHRSKKTMRFLQPEELHRLLSYPHKSKIKAALLFLADTGARIGELYNLKLEDLNETPWGFTARIHGKTGERIVPVTYDTYHALQVNLPFNWSYWYLRRMVAKAFIQADVKGTPHTLRHTFGTLWQGRESTLQEIMGHANFSTTLLYRHTRTNVLCQQHAEFSPLKMAGYGQMGML